MLFQREGIWGEEGSRRDSNTPNQGSKPWIMEKKGPKSEITEPISELPPRSHGSLTLLTPFQAPSEGREHFPRTEPEFSRLSQPPHITPEISPEKAGTPHSALPWQGGK